jgi:hypothetical protein
VFYVPMLLGKLQISTAHDFGFLDDWSLPILGDAPGRFQPRCVLSCQLHFTAQSRPDGVPENEPGNHLVIALESQARCEEALTQIRPGSRLILFPASGRVQANALMVAITTGKTSYDYKMRAHKQASAHTGCRTADHSGSEPPVHGDAS